MESLGPDYRTLLSQTKRQEKQLRLKRRWLMCLPFPKNEQKKIKAMLDEKNRVAPESLLREDEVSYETIKTFVEKGFGLCTAERKHDAVQDNMLLVNLPNGINNILLLLDDMTNKGLCHCAEILTGGSSEFVKTRCKMVKMIKECLKTLLISQNDNKKSDITKKLHRLLQDPDSFRGKRMFVTTPLPESLHAAAINVLNRLEDLPSQILSAMHRKLTGVRGYIPKMKPFKSGWTRESLIRRIRKKSMRMLSKFGDSNELQEPLAKALAVAGLTSKLISNWPCTTEFCKFSPEIEALQNDIANAICLLRHRNVRFSELKGLQILLDPNAEVPNRTTRVAVRTLLTDYLLECSDMDCVPECLFQTLAIINKRYGISPSRVFLKENGKEEVDCILSVSAQAKQIVWDLLPEHEFDRDFADAYMEDLEESDGFDIYENNEMQTEVGDGFSYSADSNDQMQGTEETNASNCISPASTVKTGCVSPISTPHMNVNSKVKSLAVTETDSINSSTSVSPTHCCEFQSFDSPILMEGKLYQSTVRNWELADDNLPACVDNGGRFCPFSSMDGKLNEKCIEARDHKVDFVKALDNVTSHDKCGKENLMQDQWSADKNQYLAIQEACDKSSMVIYHLIGHLMDAFPLKEGLQRDIWDMQYLRSSDTAQRNFRDARTLHEELVDGVMVNQVLQETVPSFPESGKDRIKQLMGLKQFVDESGLVFVGS